MDVISCVEARKKGLKRFFTGKPCKHGHLSERIVSNRCCAVCALLRTNEFNKNNKEKIAHRDAVRYRNDPDAMIARAARYRKSSKTQISARASYRWQKKKMERGAKCAAERGVLMELDEAIDIFKSQDNAFEYTESSDA